MGVIKNRKKGEFILLNSEHSFGRNRAVVHTVVEGADISRTHATILWKGHKWVVQDHSLNGTLVNQSILNRTGSDLKPGDVIKFGQMGDAEWEMVDDAAPVSYLRTTREPPEVLALASCPGVQTPDYPEISFFLTERNRWCAELSGMVVDLIDGAKLKIREDEWQFVENGGMESTINLGTRISNARIVFLLSPDEERISVEIQGDSWVMELGERVHNFLLIALARHRLSDAQNGFHSMDQGWVSVGNLADELSKELLREIDEYQINLQIHRIRKQMLNLKPYGYLFSNLVERRKGELRFSHPRFEMIKEGEVVEKLPLQP